MLSTADRRILLCDSSNREPGLTDYKLLWPLCLQVWSFNDDWRLNNTPSSSKQLRTFFNVGYAYLNSQTEQRPFTFVNSGSFANPGTQYYQMQSLVLPPSSYISTEFGHPRLTPGQERLSFNLPRSTNARRYTPRDLPPPRSMSGPVPAADSLETSGTARRPGHPELFQPVSTANVTAPTTTPIAVSGSHLPSGPAGAGAVSEPLVQRIVSAPGEEVIRQPLSVSDAFSSTRLPPSLGAQPLSQSSAVAYAPPSFGSSPPDASTRPLPQKPTRRTKAHVASACVNCKKKHLGCDPARPCRRCVLSGKEVSVDGDFRSITLGEFARSCCLDPTCQPEACTVILNGDECANISVGYMCRCHA